MNILQPGSAPPQMVIAQPMNDVQLVALIAAKLYGPGLYLTHPEFGVVADDEDEEDEEDDDEQDRNACQKSAQVAVSIAIELIAHAAAQVKAGAIQKRINELQHSNSVE